MGILREGSLGRLGGGQRGKGQMQTDRLCLLTEELRSLVECIRFEMSVSAGQTLPADGSQPFGDLSNEFKVI